MEDAKVAELQTFCEIKNGEAAALLLACSKNDVGSAANAFWDLEENIQQLYQLTDNMDGFTSADFGLRDPERAEEKPSAVPPVLMGSVGRAILGGMGRGSAAPRKPPKLPHAGNPAGSSSDFDVHIDLLKDSGSPAEDKSPTLSLSPSSLDSKSAPALVVGGAASKASEEAAVVTVPKLSTISTSPPIVPKEPISAKKSPEIVMRIRQTSSKGSGGLHSRKGVFSKSPAKSFNSQGPAKVPALKNKAPSVAQSPKKTFEISAEPKSGSNQIANVVPSSPNASISPKSSVFPPKLAAFRSPGSTDLFSEVSLNFDLNEEPKSTKQKKRERIEMVEEEREEEEKRGGGEEEEEKEEQGGGGGGGEIEEEEEEIEEAGEKDKGRQIVKAIVSAYSALDSDTLVYLGDHMYLNCNCEAMRMKEDQVVWNDQQQLVTQATRVPFRNQVPDELYFLLVTLCQNELLHLRIKPGIRKTALLKIWAKKSMDLQTLAPTLLHHLKMVCLWVKNETFI